MFIEKEIFFFFFYFDFDLTFFFKVYLKIPTMEQSSRTTKTRKLSNVELEEFANTLKTDVGKIVSKVEKFFQDTGKSALKTLNNLKTKLQNISVSVDDYDDNNNNSKGESKSIENVRDCKEMYARRSRYESEYLTYYTDLVEDSYAYYLTKELENDVRFYMLKLGHVLKEEYYISFYHYTKLTSLDDCILDGDDAFNLPKTVTKVVIYCPKEHFLLKDGVLHYD